ncbi:MAG TPA: restriction endonuclease subunit S, partial [Candidatus Cloacimonadota bacterium]|nr:restriction endonuclease subunit S [Candidatus Cloacimonadota bacterium]
MSKLDSLIKELCPDGVEYVKLGEVCKVFKGQQLNRDLLTEHDEYPAYNGGVSYSGFTNKYNVEANT